MRKDGHGLCRLFQCSGHQRVAHELWRHLPLANSLTVLEVQLVGQTQQTTDQKRWTFHVVSFQSAKFGQKQTKDAGQQERLLPVLLAHRMNKSLSKCMTQRQHKTQRVRDERPNGSRRDGLQHNSVFEQQAQAVTNSKARNLLGMSSRSFPSRVQTTHDFRRVRDERLRPDWLVTFVRTELSNQKRRHVSAARHPFVRTHQQSLNRVPTAAQHLGPKSIWLGQHEDSNFRRGCFVWLLANQLRQAGRDAGGTRFESRAVRVSIVLEANDQPCKFRRDLG